MKRILIAGYGKMGSWLWSLLNDGYELAVYETNIEATRSAPEVRFLHDKADAQRFSPDIFLNCVNIEHTIAVFTEMGPLLPSECMLADIASVKDELKEYYSNSGRSFVSIHPMFGPTFSDMNSPGGRTAYIISESNIQGKDFFRNCFEKAGIVIREVGFIEHDKLMASYLSVPVICALIFSSAATERAFAGTTYDRFTKVSAGVMNENVDLLRLILRNPYTTDKIAKMAISLGDIAEVLNGASEEEFSRMIKLLKDRSGLHPKL